MALTAEQIKAINKMNVASQKAALGTIISELQTAGGGGARMAAPVTLPKMASIEHSTASTIAELKSDFNCLIDGLKAAGLME